MLVKEFTEQIERNDSMSREIDKFEKEIRSKLKNREFQRNEMRGIFKVLDMIKEFRKNVPQEITGATDEEIEARIKDLFTPSETALNHKVYGEKQYNTKNKQFNFKNKKA